MFKLEKETIWANIKFEEPHFIADNLFLGPKNSAVDLNYLKENNIDRIIMAGLHLEPSFPDEIEYLKLEIDDSPIQEISQHFQEVIDFIKNRPQTNVLIHCFSGISRSGALTIAYIMKTTGLGL